MSGSDTKSQTYKQRDAESYDNVAAEFDHFAQHLAIPFVTKMLALARLQPRDRVLDLARAGGKKRLVMLENSSQGRNARWLSLQPI